MSMRFVPLRGGTVGTVPDNATCSRTATGYTIWHQGRAFFLDTDLEGVADPGVWEKLEAAMGAGPGLFAMPELMRRIFPFEPERVLSLAELLSDCQGPGLDVGCGYGRMLLPLLDEGFAIDGIDRSPQCIELLRDSLASNPSDHWSPLLVTGDVCEIAFPGRYSFAIAAMNVWKTLGSRWNLQRHLSLMADSLRPGSLYLAELTLNPNPQKTYHTQWVTPLAAPELSISWRQGPYHHLRHYTTDVVNIRSIETGEEIFRDRIRQAHYSLEWLLDLVDGDDRWEVEGFWETRSMRPVKITESTAGIHWIGLRRV